MSINKKTTLGKINISTKAIISLVAESVLDNYGVAGLCDIDGNGKIAEPEEFSKVIEVKEDKNGFEISFAMIIILGVKVTEILRSVQKKVKYVVENTFDVRVTKVNVFAQDLQKVE